MDNTTELFRIQDKIKEYEYKQFNGARLRAKVQEIEQGERYTSYFVNLEKQRANNKIMISLSTEDGTLVETQDEILKETTNLYKRLYTSEKTDDLAQDYLLNNLKQTLTDEDKDSIEGEITLNDILIAIKSFANEKSPECDGLTAKFYKTFSNVIDNDLVEVINNGFQQGGIKHYYAPRGNCFHCKKGGGRGISNIGDQYPY